MILLDKSVSIYRLSDTESNKSVFATFTIDQEAAIQPISDTKTEGGFGNYDKLYRIYMDAGVDVREGDKIKDADGNIYLVEAGGVEKRDEGIIAEHLAITAKKVNG